MCAHYRKLCGAKKKKKEKEKEKEKGKPFISISPPALVLYQI
jgi:hypothetical protein